MPEPIDTAKEQTEERKVPAQASIGGDLTITIDGTQVKAPVGGTILEAAQRAGIHIPTLCHHPDLDIAGNCRICVVEVEGERTLQAACCYPIVRPLVVRTHSRKVRQARRHIIDLLLSTHYGDCITCTRNGRCELQALAEEYGVDTARFGKPQEPLCEPDLSSMGIVRDMNKCILCRRCVRTCAELQGVGGLQVAGRSAATRIVTFEDMPLGSVICINCGQCVNRCPTGALAEVDHTDAVWRAIDDPSKHVVIQTAPAPRAAIAECFDIEPGTPLTFQMNTALREMGFDRIFDTNFTADLTIIEEGTELLLRLKAALVDGDPEVRLPQFTSCSPGWVKYIEHFYPEYLGNVSTAKSPQQMFGAVIKTYYARLHGLDPQDIVSVSLMPCTAKKFEAGRPEMCDSGYPDVDHVLTTRELGKMMREAGVDLPAMEKSDFDEPFGTATGSGVIFAATGGVMESAIRTVFDLVTGVHIEDIFANADVIPVRGFSGVRYAELTIPEVGPVPDLLRGHFDSWDWLKGATLKVAVAHGTANAKKVMEDVAAGGKFSECHFIEFMACPGGCLGGGGQPIPTNEQIRAARAQAIYSEDHAYQVRKSYENPAVAQLYREFLTDGPCSHLSHELLHTHYTPRGTYID